jgi:hypothetical protein
MVIPQNRRTFLSWLARVAAGTAVLPMAGRAVPADPTPASVPVGVQFQLGAMRYRLGGDADGPRLDLVPRWEWPEVIAHPQPTPLSTETLDVRAGAPRLGLILIRKWADGDPQRCRLCSYCTAYRPDGPDAVCCRELPAGVAEANGLFSERGAR